jgi:putative transposase
MGTAAIEAKAVVQIDGVQYQILRMVEEGLWQLEEVKTKRIVEKTDQELRSLYEAKSMRFACDESSDARAPRALGLPHREVAKRHLNEAKIRRAYAIAAMECSASQSAMEEVAHQVWKKFGPPLRVPHWSTVYRWRRKYIHGARSINAVVSRHDKKGSRASHFSPEVIKTVQGAIDSVFLTEKKRTLQDTLDKALVDTRRENKLRPDQDQLREPTRRLVKSMIDAIPAFDRCQAREGRTVALRRFRSVLKHRITQAPLERAEIDHTVLDLMVVDDIHDYLPLGRPLLTVCIDDYTRCILGINIDFEPASFLTVSRCLKHAFMPKTSLRTTYSEIDHEWDPHGVMRELSMDNGPEFHSDSLEYACMDLGIEIHYAPRKTPWFKGKVERFIGTLNRSVCHTAPGTTFSNIFEKGDYDPMKNAVVRLSKLQHVVRKWVVDVYHQKPHRILKQLPAVTWKTSIRPEDILLPQCPESLDAILGRRVVRTLTHQGIEMDKLFYNSPDITKLRRQLGDKLKVEASVDDGDLGQIVVVSPNKTRMFTVPAVTPAYAKGLTRWQHKVCKRYAAQQLDRHDSTSWLEAKDRIAEMIRDELDAKRAKKTHKRLGRYLNGSRDPSPLASVPAIADVEAVSAPAANAQAASSPSSDIVAAAVQPQIAPVGPRDPQSYAASTRRFTPVHRNRT